MGYKLRFRGYRLRFRGYDPSHQAGGDTIEIMNETQDEVQLTREPQELGPLKPDVVLVNMNNVYDSRALSPATGRERKPGHRKSYSFDDRHRFLVPDEVAFRDDESSFSSFKSSEASFRQIEHCENPDEPCTGRSSEELIEHIENPDEPMATTEPWSSSFQCLRINYLIVTLVVMLADGLQGTHLYVLYEGYGFSVASLYCLGFVTGGLMSPITGPLVDKLGRKKSALLYCLLEIAINKLEQYPVLPGLIISRMVGGVTTNLLSTVFDTWLDTEYRRRGFDKEKYEIIMRDSVVVSNLAAIGSGYLAHLLAENYGPVGPFEGAVTFTTIALVVIALVWTENFGCCEHDVKGVGEFLSDAVKAFKSDKKVLKVGVIQGLTCASIQIFIFLWSPALRHFAESAPPGTLGLDSNGEPAYGLIFGAFMAAGVLGGLTAPWIRQFTTYILSPLGLQEAQVEGEGKVRPMAVELLAAACYILSAILLLVPCLLSVKGINSFSLCLAAFLVYEYLVGLYLPCEGVIRSLYFPSEGRASIMTLPRIIVNGAVSLGVVTTNFITMRSAFSSIFILMLASAFLQLSLISEEQWSTLSTHIEAWRRKGQQIVFGQPIVDKGVLTKKAVSRSSTHTSSPMRARISESSSSCDSSFTLTDDNSSDTSLCSSVDKLQLHQLKSKLE